MLHSALRRSLRAATALLATLSALMAAPAHAAPTMYTLGADVQGVGRVLTSLDGAGAATPVFALGDGNSAYNGLVYRPGDSRFYAVANDATGQSSLVSFAGNDASTLGSLASLGTGVVGMAYRASEDVFYAASTSFTGESTLLRVTATGSTSTVGTLGFAFMGGLAFGGSPELLFGIGADASGVQRALHRIDVQTGTATLLFELGDGSLAFNGGLAWDDDADLFQVIGSNFLGASSLYRFDLSGAASLVDAGAIGPGYLHAGLTGVPGSNPIPEPGTLALLWAALLGAFARAPSSHPRRTPMPFASTLRNTVFAALVVGAGTAQAQFSSPMRDVENPDRFPYQERGSTTIQVNVVNNFITFPTPFGKRFVIEYVAVSCNSPSAVDSFPQVQLVVTRITSPSSTISLSANAVPMERRGAAPFGGYVYAGSAQLKLYSDYVPFDPTGGSGIYLNIFHTDFSVSPTCTAVLAGHTITP